MYAHKQGQYMQPAYMNLSKPITNCPNLLNGLYPEFNSIKGVIDGIHQGKSLIKKRNDRPNTALPSIINIRCIYQSSTALPTAANVVYMPLSP